MVNARSQKKMNGVKSSAPDDVYINNDGEHLNSSESHDSNEPLIEHANVDVSPSAPAHHPIRTDLDDDDEEETMGSRWPRCCAISGVVVAIIGAVLAATFPLAYHAILNYELSLQPSTLQYHMWMEPPIPLYLRVYLFNVTNAQDVVKNKAKPILAEIGPYTFQEKHERVNIKHFDANHTVQFQQRRSWHFLEDLSNGTLEENITNFNVPLVAGVYALRSHSVFFKYVFNRILLELGDDLFVTKTAAELLFDGYDDKLLDFAQQLPKGVIPPFDKFAWFYQRNNSDYYDGIFNVYTGADNIERVGVMDMWNFTKQTDYFKSHCGMVNGSFGEAFAPHRNRTSISMYITDMCRSVTLDYEADVENFGVSSYRFAGNERVFANASDVADNWCFCPDGMCNPSGIGNASPCRFGAPAFVSFPHFYLADPIYLDGVEGLNPAKDLHQFHIDLEPTMAVPSSVRARLQVNILAQPDDYIDTVADIDRRFMPMLWFEISADLDGDIGWWVNVAVHMPVIGTASFFALLVVSLIVVAISGTILARRRSRTHVMTPIDDKVDA